MCGQGQRRGEGQSSTKELRRTTNSRDFFYGAQFRLGGWRAALGGCRHTLLQHRTQTPGHASALGFVGRYGAAVLRLGLRLGVYVRLEQG